MTDSPTFRGQRPRRLAFGTSGLRGLVTEITDLEAYLNTRGFLEAMLGRGAVAAGDEVALGGDLRPSTHSTERSIMAAVARAIDDAGFRPLYCGQLPTPALSYYAFQQGIASVMVTGSHIPFDRNGIKFNKPDGEVLKADEGPILDSVARVRRSEYEKSPPESLFLDDGMFKPGVRPDLLAETPAAVEAYGKRLLDFFDEQALAGLKVVVYEHSAVGRDLVKDVLTRLGATVYGMGRSEDFVALDTEAVSSERLALLQSMADSARREHGTVNAIVSTDGDSDRPLIVGVDALGKVHFHSGDLVGIVAAQALRADAIAVPVSSTDAIEMYFEPRGIVPFRTKIGSPHVIAKMQQMDGKAKVGWEANGGFLVGSTIEVNGRRLPPLPTRDALLPIVTVLCAAQAFGGSLPGLFQSLPPRSTQAALLDDVDPRESRALMEVLSSGGEGQRATEVKCLLGTVFTEARGFSAPESVSDIDGVRIRFTNGDIAHVRPSGNAPQLRIYAVADSPQRAADIVALGVASEGLLHDLLSLAKGVLFERAVKANIDHTRHLFEEGQPPAVIGTVSGSATSGSFWQTKLDRARQAFRAQVALSFVEDLPVNQAYGVLLLWQRLRSRFASGKGALVSFVFGEGSRATPFTETDNGQKPAMVSFAPGEGGNRLPMVELAMRYFAPVEAYLRRSGFDGVTIKWGDEVQIPTLDLSGADPRFKDADVVRFVSMRTMDEDSAKNKDWIGVTSQGEISAFISRRPLSEMERLAERGQLQRRGEQLLGGINLGSIALSRVFLDALLAEFVTEVNDVAADRKKRPDLDPQFFTALTLASIDDPREREAALDQTLGELPKMRELAVHEPTLMPRLRAVLERFEKTHGRKVRFLALDLGDVYWGDIGQHSQIYDFYMALRQGGPNGSIARALAGIVEEPDAKGNIIVGDSEIAPGIEVTGSVLIDCRIRGSGQVEDSVLIGTRTSSINARCSFDVESRAPALNLSRRAGSYRIISDQPVSLGERERATSVFLSETPSLLRVHEDTDLRDRKNNYDKPILGNLVSFAEAHRQMSELSVAELQKRREAAIAKIEG